MSDLSAVLIFWLTNLLLGFTCLPITIRIFHKFIDRGYVFSKIIGIIITAYIIWLGGSFKIIPFSKITILIVLIGLLLVNLWYFSKKYTSLKEAKLPWFWFLFEEGIFLAAFSFWSYVKAFEPSIRGLEKFMDYGFVNSILRSSYFPPLDMWLTKSPDYTGGFFINYYYFGQYIAAFLTKLSGIDSAITYNLMISILFAYTFTLSFSLGTNLIHLALTFYDKISPFILSKKRIFLYIVTGLLAGYIVTLGGNLHTAYSFTSGYPNESPVPIWQLQPGFFPDRYWYPNATRFIPFTIHEFPIYSFVVSDLHGHVSDIPLVLLTIGLLLTLIVADKNKENKELLNNGSFFRNFMEDFQKNTSIPFPLIAFLGALLSIMYMTNAWDGLIYMILTGMVFLFINFRKIDYTSILTPLYRTFSSVLFLVFFFLLSNLPFSFNFKPFVSGVGVLCAPAFLLGKNIGPLLFETGKCQKSPLYMLATLWGFFYFMVLGYLLFKIIPKIKSLFVPANNLKNKRGKIAVQTGRIAVMKENIRKVALGFLSANPVDVFVILLITISTMLLIFPEYFYMKDIYPAHYRANTMFKLGYQAFMMLGLSGAFILIRITLANKKRLSLSFIIYRFFFMLLFTLVAIYPYFAINSYFGGLKTYHGLYGLNWMSEQYPDDYKAVDWIRKNILCQNGSDCNNQPVILEANGDSYTDYARVSANTGLPTIIGWPVHEWLWRGSYDEAGRRIPEVATVYESKDLNQTKNILKKYNVEYIFLGTLERDKYKNLNQEKLIGLGKVVFESGGTRIYKVNFQ